jgi:hypothetical protein
MNYLQLRTRVGNLRGETDFSTSAANAAIDSHINASVVDICNMYPFSWNQNTTPITLTAGLAELPNDYNSNLRIYDARILGSGPQSDTIFYEIDISQRNSFYTNNYYWITGSMTNADFNSLTQTGTVTIVYYQVPTDMVNDADVCIVPDGEAVAYLAASKMYIGDERNKQLKDDYEQEAMRRISSMYQADMNFGANLQLGSLVDINDLRHGAR